MTPTPRPEQDAAAPSSVFPGDDAMAAYCRAFDWGATPLGPTPGWSQSLRTAVSTLLASRFPMLLLWGPELIQVYNSAFRPSLGAGPPDLGLGASGRDFWADIWDIIGPQFEAVTGRGESTWNEDMLVAIERNGRVEEVYWTYSYSPVRDDDGAIGGLLVVCQETTSHVVAHRRLDLLHRMAVLPEEDANAAGVGAVRTLAGDALDAPWVACFRTTPDGAHSTVERSAGQLRPVEGDWPLDEVVREAEVRLVPVAEGAGLAPWPEPVERAAVLPLVPPGETTCIGALVVGLSPRLPWDERYADYLGGAAGHIAAHIVSRERRAERDRRDRELELERARLAYVFEKAPTFLAVLRGGDHVFELANDAYSRLVGGRDIVGRPAAQALPEVVDQGFIDLLDRVLETGEPFVGERVPVDLTQTAREEPRRVYLDFVYLPLLGVDGVPSGVIVHGVDVTDHVEAQGEVERLLRESETARGEAEQANRAKSRFLATMSHEVRTPINAIMGYTELMRMQVSGPLTEKQETHLERLRTSSEHLLRLVDDMLDLSRVEAGSLVMDFSTAPVGPTAQAALDLVAPQARARNVHLPGSPAGAADARFMGDADRVRQILVNLLSNAVKFSGEGSRVSLTCATHAAPPAHPELPMSGPCVAVHVADTGMGLAADQLERVFEPFVQVDGSYTRRQGGTGLGLTISRRLARLMGGEVTVRSTPGEGSVFTVWLPQG